MSGHFTVLVIDDDFAIRKLLQAGLRRAFYRVVEADSGRAALNAVQIDKPDVVLLDLGLPDRDGLELIPLIREAGPAVIVVSARDATDQKVAALDLGADDYVSKPFDSDEVLARIRTALRHRLLREAPSPVTRIGDVEINLIDRLVTKAGAEVHLTPKEFGLLTELCKARGKVVTHTQLLRSVWGPGHDTDVEYLRVAARGIRRKLEGDRSQPSLIQNEPGVGYRLVAG